MNLHDPYLWLEEVDGEESLRFVHSENERTLNHFRQSPIFASVENDIRTVLLAKDRIPNVELKNGELYNFWQDEKSIRGVWRKTTIDSYKTGHPKWDALLDLDDLANMENENWVWRGARILKPGYEVALIFLSRGGKDATVMREFNLKTRTFVKDGFYLSESKGGATWKDQDTLYVFTDFGPNTMTDSGYARQIRLWKRGSSLSSASLILEAKPSDMSVYTLTQTDHDKKYIFHTIQKGFYTSQSWYSDPSGKLVRLPMPEDAVFWGIFQGRLFFELKSDLGPFEAGSVVYLPLSKIDLGDEAQDFLKVLFAPTDKKFFQSVNPTKNHLLLMVSDNILSRIEKVTFTDMDTFTTESVDLGDHGMASVTSTEEESDKFLVQYVDFLTPSSVYLCDANKRENVLVRISKSPDRFDSSFLRTERFEALSKDGTSIPYFVISHKDIKMDGKNPTLLYGYGGFQSSMQPSYLNFIGKVWVEKGGVYVVSNLRGGGEFGPRWHQAVLKENRYKVYEDNIAIAEDLIRRRYTSPAHLGISGRSNGGLLTGATFTSRPDLFNAVIIGVPLLDMLRYHKLLAGASWMDEYGDPEDPKMRDAILKYSPYQRLRADMKYPEVLIMTSTKDDRVHPGHARKMAARMQEQGHKVYYYENTEGGHAGSSNLEQSILWNTLEYTYLWEKLRG